MHVFPLLAKRMDVSSLQNDHEDMDRLIADIGACCASRSAELGGQLQKLADLVR